MKRHGIALVVVLLSITLVGAICTIMFSRTVSEMKHSAMNASIAQTLMLARGTANAGGEILSGPIRNKLLSIVVKEFNASGAWAFGDSPDGDPNALQPDPAKVAGDFNRFMDSLQDNINDELCTLNLPNENGATTTLRVFFKKAAIDACGVVTPYPDSIPMAKPRFVSGGRRGFQDEKKAQVYAIPFVMVAEANMGPYRRNIVIQGEYEFDATVSSFAKFALFTNKHEGLDGGPIWFNERTRFEGPVHTNQNFRFHRNPYFGDYISSAGCTNPGPDGCLSTNNRGGIFYGVNNNNVIKSPGSKPSYTNAYGTHAPQLTKGVDWNATFIKLPKESISMTERAKERGLFIEGDLSNLTLFAGTADGNPLNRNGNTWEPNPAPFQYIHACFTPPLGQPANCTIPCTDPTLCAVYRYGPDQILHRQNGANWDQMMEPLSDPQVPLEFNGMLYVNGAIQQLGGPDRENADKPDRAPPALAAFANITVANAGAGKNIQITKDLKYESVPCPEAFSGSTPYTCSNMETKNVLGVYSQDANILLGNGTNSSLENLTIHGVLMTSGGAVTTHNYNTISARGSVNLLGGIVENVYGAFGTFNSSTGNPITGYGRKFTYDKRMAAGISPPYFPGTDVGSNSARVRSFGQREQVY